jgi:catechol 2,3-dioxygenase-like lactoylglutathione lyase family enzyme
MRLLSLVALAAFTVGPLPAQLAPPNATGAAIAHVHINARDIDAQERFWSQLGGKPMNNEKLRMVQFPGIYIVLRQQNPTGGTAGSVLNHFGFHVKNINESMAKWKAAGLTIEPPGNNPKQGYLVAPDNIRVEIIEDASIPGTIAMHHIHLFVPDPLAAQAWYVKNFGAIAGKRGQFDTANVPGAEFTFAKSDMALPGTKDRAVDHIGFEVKNVDQFVKDLEAKGTRPEAPIRTSANASKLRLAYITDPWGTYIELTQGLPPTPAESAAR